MKLSEHFDLSEFTVSQEAVRKGINNLPTDEIISRLRDLCTHILEPIRDLAGKPLSITSGYRSPELNQTIGGSTTSQHCKGEAADFHAQGYTTEELFQLVKSSNIPYDQLIQEFSSWVHVSYRPNNRRQALYAVKENGQTKYEPA